MNDVNTMDIGLQVRQSSRQPVNAEHRPARSTGDRDLAAHLAEACLALLLLAGEFGPSAERWTVDGR